ncbi:hypothetical protein AGLY_010702 [Aphis glycines]|uniref:Uncharacterized protein n=1 Tax=Aphis glycines TaxID=307491 RepID=A0A6G0TEC0_APHGL|nr:hypothetical protein AGLY_010702 [Aphis glycines]
MPSKKTRSLIIIYNFIYKLQFLRNRVTKKKKNQKSLVTIFFYKRFKVQIFMKYVKKTHTKFTISFPPNSFEENSKPRYRKNFMYVLNFKFLQNCVTITIYPQTIFNIFCYYSKSISHRYFKISLRIVAGVIAFVGHGANYNRWRHHVDTNFHAKKIGRCQSHDLVRDDYSRIHTIVENHIEIKNKNNIVKKWPRTTNKIPTEVEYLERVPMDNDVQHHIGVANSLTTVKTHYNYYIVCCKQNNFQKKPKDQL